jgi:hypothetical protein
VIYGCYALLIYTDTQLHLQERQSGMSIADLSPSFGI